MFGSSSHAFSCKKKLFKFLHKWVYYLCIYVPADPSGSLTGFDRHYILLERLSNLEIATGIECCNPYANTQHKVETCSSYFEEVSLASSYFPNSIQSAGHYYLKKALYGLEKPLILIVSACRVCSSGKNLLCVPSLSEAHLVDTRGLSLNPDL